jgi:hypothetical protein
MATSADITLNVSDFPSEIPCGRTHLSYLDKILVYRHGVLLVAGRDYLLDFEFTKDGVVASDIDWCDPSNSFSAEITVKVKPEFGPSSTSCQLE